MLGQVYVDFDGTIAPSDPTDRVFARFCGPKWLSLERACQQGRLSPRATMAQQVELLRATPAALSAFVDELKIDPEFAAFVALCRRWDLRVVVVSDGLDRVVLSMLRAAGFELPVFANRLTWLGGERWKLDFPYAASACAASLGNCKCAHRSPRALPSLAVVVGDGRSDFCIAERADLVLAKGQLAAHRRRRNLPHQPIDNFAHATVALDGWLAQNALKSA
ncbi:MAG TPA: HAD-IB family phosphatase [Hyphomicrobiaceae bacterium]|jgi:HAD superfamily phosphoserine phosphatase-like hydrolase|nr:HAD-IB family phosphatase [Hyphomicrobiaceae bacterium]